MRKAPSRCRLVMPVLALLLSLPAAAEFTATTEHVERGHYRLEVTDSVPVRAERLAEVIRDDANFCAERCRFAVPSIVRSEAVATEPDGKMIAWNEIDDVLDASYFSTTHIERTDDAVLVHFATPTDRIIDKYATGERPHKPFFYDQHGTWKLSERLADDGSFLTTDIGFEMVMRSDRFVVNALPGRVLAGSKEHLEAKLTELRRLARDNDR